MPVRVNSHQFHPQLPPHEAGNAPQGLDAAFQFILSSVLAFFFRAKKEPSAPSGSYG
jgi:hypothetical protein